MAKHELVLRQSPDLALGQSHDMVIGQSHLGLGLGSHDDAADLVLGHHHHHESLLVLGHHQHHHHQLHHHHHHQLALRQTHDDTVVGDDQTTDDLGLPDGHELAITAVGGHDLSVVVDDDNDNLDHLSIEQAHEQLALPSSSSSLDLVVAASHHGQMLLNPVLQTRLVVSPNHELHIGQEFPDVKSCRRALRDAAIACHFEIQTVKSDKTRFTAKCAAEGCPWRIHAAKLPGLPTFTIRTIHETHTCSGITHLGHQQASVQWVASSVEERLRENPHYKPKEILEEIHRLHGITLSYKQAWRGKERIMAAVRGSFEEGYRLLPEYCEQIRRTNPGSIASVWGNPEDNCFKRLFVSFYACIYGFVNACRPLIGLDRTLLKSKYLGTLLLATGFDGDGASFPLAFGVVDEENAESWIWFLSELHGLLEANTENMPMLTILSDMQKGVVEGVEFNFPTSYHGLCMRHLTESFHKEFSNTMLVSLFWEAANVLTPDEFQAKMFEIDQASPEAAAWIKRINERLWATSHFEGARYGHLTASALEHSGWISEASALPVIQMMECIRRQLMTWFNERRETSARWSTTLVPSAEERVSAAIDCASGLQVTRANEALFHVKPPTSSPHDIVLLNAGHTVNVRNRACSCRGWDLYGLPCAHAAAALLSCRQNVHRYTESCFTVATYRKAYSQTIHPVPDKSLWKEFSDQAGQGGGVGEEEGEEKMVVQVVINPPKSLRPPSRPRKKRVRAEDRGRVKRVVHCSRCNETGHFRTTCAAPI